MIELARGHVDAEVCRFGNFAKDTPHILKLSPPIVSSFVKFYFLDPKFKNIKTKNELNKLNIIGPGGAGYVNLVRIKGIKMNTAHVDTNALFSMMKMKRVDLIALPAFEYDKVANKLNCEDLNY